MGVPLDKSVICPVLIGRDAYLGLVKRLTAQAAQVHALVALVSGEAGIVKSRLVAEVKNLAARKGMRVLQGNCFELDQALPFGPLIDLLQNALTAHPLETRQTCLGPNTATLGRFVPELSLLPAPDAILAHAPVLE